MKAGDFAKVVQGGSIAEAAQKLISDVTGYLALIETEQTKRLEIRSAYKAEVKRIEALKSTLESYLNRSFDERRQNFEQLFFIARTSISKGDIDSLEKSLSAVVELAKTSPLAEVKSLSSLRSAMDDPDHEFQI